MGSKTKVIARTITGAGDRARSNGPSMVLKRKQIAPTSLALLAALLAFGGRGSMTAAITVVRGNARGSGGDYGASAWNDLWDRGLIVFPDNNVAQLTPAGEAAARAAK